MRAPTVTMDNIYSRTLMQAYFASLSDEERMYLLRISAASDAAAARGAYLDWLDSRDDPRAEALRLAEALRSEPDSAMAHSQRHHLRALQADIDPRWWRLLGFAQIRNCGTSEQSPPGVRFRLVCSQTWEGMIPTGVAGVRACQTCERPVYLCRSVAEAEDWARAGACISVPAALVNQALGEVTRMVLGQPDGDARWAERIFGEHGDPPGDD
ncbi:MAG: hypothetical protein AAGC55_10845 [Myxococcota bacterium]